MKFHAGLQRRDKPPLASAVLGLLALAFGASILPAAMALGAEQGPGIYSVVLAFSGACVAWGAYGMTFPLALASLRARREQILGSVTRS